MQKKETKIHYALNQNKIIQSNNIISLAATFDTVKLQFTDREDTNLYNVLTGRLFKDNVKRDILSTHVKGKQLYKEFIDERLRRGSTISISGPLKKKARLKGMKNSNKKAHYVTDGKLHQLERHCDLFRTIAVLNTESLKTLKCCPRPL